MIVLRFAAMADRFAEARRDVFEHARKMWQAGLVVASSGNVSRRIDHDLIAITPSRISYDVMNEDDIVVVEIENGRAVESEHAPSYELPMHLSIMRSRADVNGIVHTHSPFVTTLSILRKPLPPVIDEMVVFFGGAVDVAEYAFTGTEQVGTNVVRALHDRAGAILANHGNVCVGRDLERALHVAMVMESAAQAYVQALAIGAPVTLPESAINAGRRMFEERR
jgi:L-fuculose-phosphate aldolase